jgi:signal transduction histidine kinase/CheY-like chemotaxis protein
VIRQELRAVEVQAGPSPFAGGGDVGLLLEAVDWAATPLGGVSTWSPALRTMVGMSLRNHFPLILWWGRDFIQIYNDAFSAILAGKHPRSLAQPAAACWAEIWNVVGPMIEAPFKGGPATWSDDLLLQINRKGFVEETHFKFAYSAVPDDSAVGSDIGGVLGTVAEITEEVFAGRQLATLRDLARHAGDAASSAMACQLAARTLGGNDRDIPCSLFYLTDPAGRSAQLAGSSGFGETFAKDAQAQTIFFEAGAAAVWPISGMMRDGISRAMRDRRATVVSEVAGMELPRGAWNEPPNQVVILPLLSPEQPEAYGVLLIGVSPRRELNHQYRTFLDLAADHAATGIRNARAYQQERARAKKLAEVDRAKTEFFSNVSHEFRTPLTLLIGPLEDMRVESKSGSAERGRIDVIHRNALRLLKLVNTLLDFSRMEAGRVEAQYVPTDLSALTVDLATSFRATIVRAGLELVVDCQRLPEPVFVDRDMWEKIVLNLMSNAFKFTFSGSIRVQLRSVDDCVELRVADTGIGIVELELPRLFERFHRIEGVRSRSHEGSGIGLSFVRELTRMHRGEVHVTSTVGEGSAFTVRIPRGSEHLPKERVNLTPEGDSVAHSAPSFVEEARGWGVVRRESRVPSPPTPVAAESSPSPAVRARILFADDNADMRDYVARLLGKRWQVETVVDGVAALDAIDRERPALVLADVMMPRLDGFGLLRRLRADSTTQTLPVILLSARAGEESTMEGLQAGANDYLIKPFSAGDLLARVSSQLKLAALRDQVEHEREAARLLMETLFNAAPAAIALIRGHELVIAFANPRCVELWQRAKASDVVGKPLLVALPELQGQGFDETLRQVMRTGEPAFGNEAPATLLKEGKEFRALLNFAYVPTRDAEGAIDGVAVFAFDVTREIDARGRAQLGERVGQALVTKEGLTDQLRACCEALVTMGAAFARIWTYDATHEVLDLRASAGIYEHTTGRHARIPVGSLKAGRIAQTREPTLIQNVMGDPQVVDQEWAARERLVSFAGYPLIVGNRLVGVVAVYARVELSDGMASAISTVADQIAIAVDRDAGERFRELFIGILGHDLRNPLNAVLMATYLLLQSATDKEKPVLVRLGNSAKRMERMIAQLLDFTRARSGGGIALLREPSDLGSVCQQVVGELLTANPDRAIEVVITGDTLGFWDTDRIAQVFSNLVANAITYGSANAAVQVRLVATDTEVECAICNMGPAIPSDLLPHLFDPFRRARHAKGSATQGLGLGLFICQQIVAAHGGSTRVQSTEADGTVFTVTLPKRGASV